MKANVRTKYALFLAFAAFGFVFDQLTKSWAREALKPRGSAGLPVVGQTLRFIYSENPGIAFSQLQSLHSGRWILSVASAVALLAIVVFVRGLPATRRAAAVAIGLIGGGALGNLIDRIRFGKVTDFIQVDLGFWPFNPWAVFNVADAVLVAGVILLGLESFFGRKGETAKG